MRRFVRPLLLLALLGVAACGSGRKERGPAPPLPPRTTVRIDNRSFLDMTVYALNGGQRVRLGNVPGVSQRTFTIPANLVFGVATLRFLADPIGGRTAPISHEILVRPGDRVELVIPNR